MQILLIEDDAMMGSTLTQGLSDLGLPPTELFHCKEIASLPALLRQHAFDAILCRQYHHQAHEGVRLLHEAHHLGLLAPGCVLLLLEQDEDTGQFPPSDLYFTLRLAVPFTTEQLAHSLQALLALTTVTRPLATPMALREWRSACAQCEDLLYRHASHKGLEAQMDRVKGYMLLQAGERVQAAQHYAICTTEHDAWWPRQGLNQALLGLNRVESAHKDLARNRERLPPVIHQALVLACQLHEAQWDPAWETLSGLLQRCPWQPQWRQVAILLALLRRDEGQVLTQATDFILHYFPKQTFRHSVERCLLDATLAVLWHPPGEARVHELQQALEELGQQAVTLRAHEEGLLRALMLGLDYRFDDALMLLAKHPPEAARDNHLNQLLGVAVSQFCGLPHHAQRYLAQLGQYQGPVAQTPLLQGLILQVVDDLARQLAQREQQLTQLREERQRAMTTGQLQLAVQSALTLQERFPAQAGDAWQLLVLLTQCWPAGMAAPAVARLVDRLEQRLNHSAAFLEHHGNAYRETLQQVRSHLAPKLPPLGPHQGL